MSKKFATNKLKMATIALVLVLTMAPTLAICLPVYAQPTVKVYATISVAPNPVGVGQTVLCVFFLDRPTPAAVGGYNPLYNWNNFTVTITKPDQHTLTMGPYTSDATGGNWFNYVPDTVGTYYFEMSFPGQTLPPSTGFPQGQIVAPATSAKVALTVQQEQIPGLKTWPLPTDYWQRPIYGEFRGWSQISGDWLMANYNSTGPFNPYTTAPNTAHIVWTKPLYMGGVVGGDFGDLDYYQAPNYQPYFGTIFIIDGRVYNYKRLVPGNAWEGLYCWDIRTGEQLWFQNSSVIGGGGPGGGGTTANLYGQLLDYEGVNAHGVLPYFWNTAGTTWRMFDANTGRPILTYVNVPSGGGVSGATFKYDEHGSFLAYMINGQRNWLCMWNSSKVVNTYTPTLGAAYQWRQGIEWNVTIPDRPGVVTFGGTALAPQSTKDVIFAAAGTTSDRYANLTLCAYSAKDGHELWWKNVTDPILELGSSGSELFPTPPADGVILAYKKQTRQWWGLDVYTGNVLWGPTQPYTNSWDMFGYGATCAYGKMFFPTYGGHVYCHDLKTGNLLWTWTGPSSGFNTPYGSYPFYCYPSVADGKVFVVTNEHTPNSPYYQGARMYVIDANTGTQVWNVSGWFTPRGMTVAIADGYAVGHNCYDGQIYCFGKGKTATTVSASPKVVANGSSVLIEGTVMDQSPSAVGTPAISDQYMTPWMEYLYQQKPMPNNVTGVPVQLQAVGSDGSITDIGTVTSDAFGNFKYAFCPTKPDTYTILATFAGSNSYYASYASTGAAVGPSPPATTPAAEQPAPDNTPLFAGIIAAVAIGIVAIVLVLYTLYTVKKQRK